MANGGSELDLSDFIPQDTGDNWKYWVHTTAACESDGFVSVVYQRTKQTRVIKTERYTDMQGEIVSHCSEADARVGHEELVRKYRGLVVPGGAEVV